MDLPQSGHDPVLLKETLELLSPGPGKVMVDCTLGRGGHARALAEAMGPTGLLLALDADPRNLEYARAHLTDVSCPIRFFHANFAELSGPETRDLATPLIPQRKMRSGSTCVASGSETRARPFGIRGLLRHA